MQKLDTTRNEIITEHSLKHGLLVDKINKIEKIIWTSMGGVGLMFLFLKYPELIKFLSLILL